jgi:hypothetical protein
MNYDRNKAVHYAHRWAHGRNPAYYDFDSIGGDCTNFISQCLYSGCGIMNYTRDTGWYYNSPNSRSAAWSGVEYLHRFLTNNRRTGPFASELPLTLAQVGDIVQLSFDGSRYEHSLFVVDVGGSMGNIEIATHTYDSDYRPLNTYTYQTARLLHIEGVRG